MTSQQKVIFVEMHPLIINIISEMSSQQKVIFTSVVLLYNINNIKVFYKNVKYYSKLIKNIIRL
jgi:hypothetical protein